LGYAESFIRVSQKKTPQADGVSFAWGELELFHGLHGHVFSILRSLGFEDNPTVGFGEESMVFPTTYVYARMEARASLSNENIAGTNQLITKTLHPETFGFRITTVAAAAARFFVCHG
jgi:hypothetical protein